MPQIQFPDPNQSRSPEGIIALGGNLEPDTLLSAYRHGIFPWPIDGLPLPWFCPPKRAILEFSKIHIPKSLAKVRKKCSFKFTLDQAFDQVIQACASIPRPDQTGTWINRDMEEAYIQLHELGYAHSLEVWNDTQLIGGIYGVDAGGTFAGESMFHIEPNASKLALLNLCDYLKTRGLEWIDIQVITPHLKTLGAEVISREHFLQKLKATQKQNLKLF